MVGRVCHTVDCSSLTTFFDLNKMEAVAIYGYGLIRPVRRFTALLAHVVLSVVIVSSVSAMPGLQPTAHAAVFNPSTPAELVDAFATASTNAQDDIVNLGWNTFELTAELILKPDDGHSLELRNGTLERSEESASFRLLNLLEVPGTAEHDGLPVIIDGVEFKNGLFINSNDLNAGNNAGGGALLSNRNTFIRNSQFADNRVLGRGSGGAIKHNKLLEISKTLFVNNRTSAVNDVQLAQGGAIAADAGARLSVEHSYFQSNIAARGGAIFASNKAIDLSITRSTFEDNRAQTNGGAIWSDVGEGGVRISNTIFTENRAAKGGGALFIRPTLARIILFHLTIWGNESDPGLGAGIRVSAPLDDSRFSLQNSIIANNIGGNCSGIRQSSLSISNSSHNVLDDDSCGQLGINEPAETEPLLSGEPDYYGDTIPALPIAIISQARNLVPRANCLPFDSRDIPRLDNGFIPDEHCDAGAYEYLPQEHIDMDGDNVHNPNDNCVRVSNPLQSDIDADGRGDECDRRDDRDSDDDVVLNFHDNCPTKSNFLQLDSDGNGIGDACEQTSVRLTLAPIIR